MNREMKDSGIEWIGEIPKQWDIMPLKAIFTESHLRSVTKNETLLSLSQYVGVKPKLENDTAESHIEDSYEGYKIVKAGQFVMNIMLAWNGSYALSEYDGIISPAYCVFDFRINCYKKYFHYLLKTSGYPDAFKTSSKGIIDSRLRLYPEQFYKFSTIIPSIKEQKKIANYLDKKCGEIDELIALQEQMITELQNYKQAVITEAVTKGLHKNVHQNDSDIEWIGEIPEHWKVKRMKNICSTNNSSLSDKTPGSFEFEYVDIGSVSFELGIHKTERYAFIDAPSRARKIAQLGDIIVSTVRTYLRAIDIIDSYEKEKYIYSTGFAILCPNEEILSKFLTYICRSEYFTYQVSIYSSGINYPSINDSALKNINIVVPPIIEQQAISDYLDKRCNGINELISIKRQKIDKLIDYKKSLIFECVTGKKDFN